jgi:RNA recognition motif-containing protein
MMNLDDLPDEELTRLHREFHAGACKRMRLLLFAQAGNVTSADLIQDQDSGQSKGFAFVTMGTPAEAQKAIDMFNAHSLADRALKVNVAKPREERGGYQNRLSAGREQKVKASKPRPVQGGYQSRLSAFGNGSGPTGPRRRGGSQRH